MDCCSPPSLATLSRHPDGGFWCPICGSRWAVSLEDQSPTELVIKLTQTKPGRAEPAELRGILIPE